MIYPGRTVDQPDTVRTLKGGNCNEPTQDASKEWDVMMSSAKVGTVFKGKMQPQIAGLETRDFGRLNLKGKDFHHAQKKARHTWYVFQCVSQK